MEKKWGIDITSFGEWIFFPGNFCWWFSSDTLFFLLFLLVFSVSGRSFLFWPAILEVGIMSLTGVALVWTSVWYVWCRRSASCVKLKKTVCNRHCFIYLVQHILYMFQWVHPGTNSPGVLLSYIFWYWMYVHATKSIIKYLCITQVYTS